MKAIRTICAIAAGVSIATGAYLLTRDEKPELVDTASASHIILFTEEETAQFIQKDLEAAVGVYEGKVVEHVPDAFIWGDYNMIIESFKVNVDKTYKGEVKGEIEFIRATDTYKPRGNILTTSTGIKPIKLKVGSSYFFFMTAPIHEFRECQMLLLEQDALPVIDGEVHFPRQDERFVVDHNAFSDSLAHMVERCSIPYLRDHSDAVIRATLQDHIPEEGVTVDGPKYHDARWGPVPVSVQTVIFDVYKQPSCRELKVGDAVPIVYQRAEWTDRRCLWTEFTPFKRDDDVIFFLKQSGDSLHVEPALYHKWNVVGDRVVLFVENEWPQETYVVESYSLDQFQQLLKK